LRKHHSSLIALITLVILIGWVWPARLSIWIDEAGTYWIVKDGLAQVFERSYYWSNFSPYYLVAWLAVQVGGQSELLMRVPSLLAMGAAAVFIYRIGTRLGDEETGVLAAGVFAVIFEVAFAAADARPYAFTLMTLTGYVLVLLRWLEAGRWRDAVGVVVFAVLTTYGHVLLAPGLVVPTVYALWRTSRRWHLAGLLMAVAALCIPLALQLRAYLSVDTVRMFAEVPGLSSYLQAVAPPQIFATLMVGVVTAYVVHAGMRSQWTPPVPTVIMLLAWVLLVPSVYFALGRTTSMQLFLPRYLLSTAPAISLLIACFIRSFHPIAARRTVAGVVMGLSLAGWMLSSGFHRNQDWRSAMAAVRNAAAGQDMPLVTASCFVEAQTPKDLEDPRLREALFAPEFFYPPGTRVIHLPFRFDEAYTLEVASRELAQATRFLVLTCDNHETMASLTAYAEGRRFTLERETHFRGLQLRQFGLPR